MRISATLLALSACAPTQVWSETPLPARCAAGGLPQGEAVLGLTHEKQPRSTLLWAPASAGPHDLVVDLHDFRAEPRRQAHYSTWVPFAQQIGALLAAPDGRSSTWNAGNNCCGKAAEKESTDRELLDRVADIAEATGCTSGRVLATGIGNGGMMAERWACESDRVDAVVSVGGALQLDTCENKRPIPIVHYHGDQDTQYPVGGSVGYPEQGTAKPASAALEIWKIRNRVVGPPIHSEGGALTCDRWEGAAPVVWCTVHGMKDSWPGSQEWPAEPAFPLSDATTGPYNEVIIPWWNTNLQNLSPSNTGR